MGYSSDAPSGGGHFVSSWTPEPRELWMDDAVCAETAPDIFFPEKGGSTRDAKALCQSCGVRQQCLDYALERDERFGIWGGLSERERRRVARGTRPRPRFVQDRPSTFVERPVPIEDRPVSPHTSWTRRQNYELMEFVTTGASDRQIAKAMKVELHVVAYWRKKAGLKPNREAPVKKVTLRKKRHLAWTSADTELVRELNGQGLTDAQIAAQMDRTTSLIWKYRTQLGLPSHGKVGRPRKNPAA